MSPIIQAADKPYLPLARCSRCRGEIAGDCSLVVLEWNGIEFRYCNQCSRAMNLEDFS